LIRSWNNKKAIERPTQERRRKRKKKEKGKGKEEEEAEEEKEETDLHLREIESPDWNPEARVKRLYKHNHYQARYQRSARE